ncbi:hypothetical protein LOTGIDRAFT_171207 [Lottia gigantea]|uniref:Uncharacterized protein n=1 Tax=Lottia gigantea TaxID=225164 RepID=V4CMT0_LOTGI|nr:hypothetical protein LOTGIDRAFT_171207 [Lottia gigantea]ESP03675.1 hypothetical protein LOTGIDRAFT_171207 [Lottia gigantea]
MDLQYFHRIWIIHILNFMYFYNVDCAGNHTGNVPYNIMSTTTTAHESVLGGPPTNTGLIVGGVMIYILYYFRFNCGLCYGLIVGGVMIALIIFLLVVVIIIKSRKNKWKRKASKTERYKAPESEEFVEPISRKCSEDSRRLSDFDEIEPV